MRSTERAYGTTSMKTRTVVKRHVTSPGDPTLAQYCTARSTSVAPYASPGYGAGTEIGYEVYSTAASYGVQRRP
eukprot:759261-Rhodomonas_salina.1